MWNGVSQRVKAIMAAKEREQARLHLPIHANRADIFIHLADAAKEHLKKIAGRTLLTDFKPKGLYFYSTERLPPNLEVIFEMNHPEKFKLIGKIIFCQYQPGSARVITDQPFPYRVGMGFHFQNEGEEIAYTEFCERTQNSYVSPRTLFEKSPEILSLIHAVDSENAPSTPTQNVDPVQNEKSEESTDASDLSNVTHLKSAA